MENFNLQNIKINKFFGIFFNIKIFKFSKVKINSCLKTNNQKLYERNNLNYKKF